MVYEHLKKNGRKYDNLAQFVFNEREKLVTKIRQLETDIHTWENNIGFFAHSKNAEALMKEVQNKIARAKEQINMMLEKIRLIDNPETATAAEPAAKPATEKAQALAENAPAAESSEAVAAEEQTTTQTTEQE